MLLTKVVSGLRGTFRRHHTALNSIIDPVEAVCGGNATTVEQSGHHFSKNHFLFMALFVTASFGYGTFGMHYIVEGHFGPDFWCSPYTMVHQFVPRVSWSAVDMVVLIDYLGSMALYTVFLFRSDQTITNHRLTISDERQLQVGQKPFLSESETVEFLIRRRRLKLLLRSVFGVLYGMLLVEFTFYVWIVHAVYDRVPLWVMLIYWNAVNVLAWGYMLYPLFTAITYVIIVDRMIRIRQRTILLKIKRLNQRLIDAELRQCSAVVISSLWHRFEEANRRLMTLCSLTKRYSRHCLPVVSVIIPYYITAQVYMLYAFIFLNSEEPEFFLIIVIGIDLCLFGVINQCASVAVHNRSLERANQAFGHCFQREVRRLVPNRDSSTVFMRQLIKCLFLRSHKRLHPYTFRAVGNFRIVTGTYPLILTYIGGAFIFITKQQRRHLTEKVPVVLGNE